MESAMDERQEEGTNGRFLANFDRRQRNLAGHY